MALGGEHGEPDANGMHFRWDGDRLFQFACKPAMGLVLRPRHHGYVFNGQRVTLLDSVCAAAVRAKEFMRTRATT